MDGKSQARALARRIAAYCAAMGGVAAGASAQADTIVTSFSPALRATPNTTPLLIDVDGDGSAEVRVRHVTASRRYLQGVMTTFSGGTQPFYDRTVRADLLWLEAVRPDVALLVVRHKEGPPALESLARPEPQVFSASDSLDHDWQTFAATAWLGHRSTEIARERGWYTSATTFTTSGGATSTVRRSWSEITNTHTETNGQAVWDSSYPGIFLGLRFERNGGQQHFGALRFHVLDPLEIAFETAAWESNPDAPLRLSSSGAEVPEPGALGLLACGAAGVAYLRRRRRTARR